MAVSDDFAALVARVKNLVDLAAALIHNLRAESATVGLTAEQLQVQSDALKAVEAALTDATK